MTAIKYRFIAVSCAAAIVSATANAAQNDPVLLPNALLRDFTGYTLTVAPARAPLAEFIDAYRTVVRQVYSPGRRLRKLVDDLSYFLPRGFWFPAMLDTIDTLAVDATPDPRRSLIAGTDTAPPEMVPLDVSDFRSEEERAQVMGPWRVTDQRGTVLPQWLTARAVFERKPRRIEVEQQSSVAVGAG